jgi:tetratricopeptide (TPR) repeat protein
MAIEKKVAEVQSALREMYHEARYADALELATSFSSEVEEHFGEDHPVSASFLNNRALMHRSMGQYASAMPLYERALRAYEKVVGKEHPSTTTCLSNMSYLCKTLAASGEMRGVEKLAMLERAREYGEQALQNKRALSMPEHPDVAIAQYNLGAVLVEMKSFDRAELNLREALALLRKRFGAQDNRLTATALNNVGVCLKRKAEHVASSDPDAPPLLAELDAARAAYDEALQMRSRLLGEVHPDTLAARHNIAELCETLATTGGVELFFNRAAADFAAEANDIRLEILKSLEAEEDVASLLAAEEEREGAGGGR